MAVRSQVRCCPCMKTGRCVRCQCVKNGLSCVDCWPSLSNPARCKNLNRLSSSIIAANSRVTDNMEDSHTLDCVSPNDSGSQCSQIWEMLKLFVKPAWILKRIPRLSRPSAARKFAAIVEQVVSRNDVPAWDRLLQFPRRCLRLPQRGGKRWNLASLINKQVSEESNNLNDPSHNVRSYGRKSGKSSKSRDVTEALAARVSSKLEEGDYRGAVRLACSRDTIAEHSLSNIETMRLKHPPGIRIPPLKNNHTQLLWVLLLM